jgi:hypothetical protein
VLRVGPVAARGRGDRGARGASTGPAVSLPNVKGLVVDVLHAIREYSQIVTPAPKLAVACTVIPG